MVNHLLNEAQLAGEKTALGFITTKNNEVAHHYPITENSSEEDIKHILQTITDNNEQVYAVYRSHDSAQHQRLSAMITDPDVLQLVISLDIKGVLQLRGFQQSQLPHEIELTIQ